MNRFVTQVSHFARVGVVLTLGGVLLARGEAARGESANLAVQQFVAKEYASLEALYKTIHRNPELSRQEEKTAKLLAEELRKAGFEVTENVGKYADGKGAFGVVGVMKNGP